MFSFPGSGGHAFRRNEGTALPSASLHATAQARLALNRRDEAGGAPAIRQPSGRPAGRVTSIGPSARLGPFPPRDPPLLPTQDSQHALLRKGNYSSFARREPCVQRSHNCQLRGKGPAMSKARICLWSCWLEGCLALAGRTSIFQAVLGPARSLPLGSSLARSLPPAAYTADLLRMATPGRSVPESSAGGPVQSCRQGSSHRPPPSAPLRFLPGELDIAGDKEPLRAAPLPDMRRIQAR